MAILTTKLYIEQSGDIEFLLENQLYFKDLQAIRGEEKDNLWNLAQGNNQLTEDGDKYKGSILEHLLIQHLTVFYDVGEHNILKLHGADWNDALDMASERGESVAFSALYAGNLEDIAELLKILKYKMNIKNIQLAEEIQILLNTDISIYDSIDKKLKILKQYCERCRHSITGKVIEINCDTLIEDIRVKAKWLKDHIQKNEWISNEEGFGWFNGYYDNNGRRVEGGAGNEARMMLTGQVFTIMSNTANEDQVRSIIKACDNYLYDESIGGYKLNTNFNEIKTDLGRMFGFAYGHKENGSVFSHMAIMYANALYERGFVKEGFKVIEALYSHCNKFEISRIYPGVPEYINAKGRGMYHYLTGSASWLILTVLTEMFGVKGELGDLKFEPKLLLKQFDENCKAAINMTFAERRLHIEYINEASKEVNEYRIKEIYVDNIKYNFENYPVMQKKDIILLDERDIHNIKVILE